MKKISSFIVKYSKIILVLFIAMIVYSVLSINKVNIEYSVTSYLPLETDTKKALDIMDEEFITYGTSTILIRNITYEDAYRLKEEIVDIDGVKELKFENTEDYYKESTALFSITYTGNDEDDLSINAYNEVINKVKGYDALVASSLIDNYANELQSDINKILIYVIIIIILVLLFTSNSVAEVIVFLIVFATSAILNMGTNYWFGTISFISNSVCVILQLALAIDYAIILSHRFSEEKSHYNSSEEAMIEALSKAISEIFGSSLTTISGLLALCCMTLKLGADLGLVLAKSIIFSMLTVFLLMPALMLLFSKAIDKTSHKNLVPKISFFGKAILKLRFVLPVIFLILVCVCGVLSFNVDYVYAQDSIDTSNPTEAMIANKEINRIFGSKNQFVILVPKDESYENEIKVVKELEKENTINEITSISNVKLNANGETHSLIEEINYKDLAHFVGTDYDTAKTIFKAYCYFNFDDSKDGLTELAIFEANPDKYTCSILDLADCAFKYNDFIEAALGDDIDAIDNYHDIKEQINDAEDQLIGINYTRVVCNITTEVEAKETFNLIERLNKNIKNKVNGAIFAGESMSAYDLNSSFSTDNLLISILTIVFVYAILIFTLKNWGIPLLLVATIQGAIFINFSIPVITNTNLYFFVYLIVSAIQMGATIDYAIVSTTRYQALIETMDKKTAVIETLNQVFPTIITSGIILSFAGFLINFLVSDPLISTLGLALGRGTIISILSVMCVLPLLLYFFYDKLKKTDLPKSNKMDILFNKIKEKKNEKNI